MLGSTLFGSGTATNLQARYAATDLATASTRARALATVVWATTVGVVLGPNLTGPAVTWPGRSACRRSRARSCSRSPRSQWRR